MADKLKIDETIELFVKGKLSEPALSEFKELMASDKAIASEVNFQKYAIEGIKQSRKMALKSRLEAINVSHLGTSSTSSTSSFVKYFSFKSVGIAVATIGVGVSAYLFTQSQIDSANDSNLSESQQLIQDSITQSTTSIADNGNSYVALNQEEQQDPVNQKEENVKPEENAVKSTPNKGENLVVKSKRKQVSANGEQMLDQKFDDGTDAEISAQVPQIPTTNAVEEKALHASDVDIKNVSDSKYNFHYMLKESTLFLYGNFDASPYEILEFNEKDQQSFYLFYDQSFFALKNGQTDPIKLKKISDPKLLQSLIDARNKKH